MTLYVSATYRDTQTSSSASSRTDHAIVQVRLLDCNDNAPAFTRPVYTTTLHTNVISSFLNRSRSLPLLRVEAIDRDADVNGLVVYSIDESNEYADWFHMDPHTGVLSLLSRPSDERTINEDDLIELTVRARDSAKSASEQLSATSRVRVRVVSSREKRAPECAPRRVMEARAGREYIGVMRARDPDEGVRAQVAYKILDRFDLFELRPSGRFNHAVLASRPGVYLKPSRVSHFSYTFVYSSFKLVKMTRN